MGLAGWLIVRSAQTGLSVTSTFSWIYPAAGVEALAVVRTAARYGERLTTHEATLQLLARLRARVFASATRMKPRRLHRFHSGDLLDRVQADIDSLDRIVLAVAVPAVVAELAERFGATDAPRRRWSAREGAGRRRGREGGQARLAMRPVA
jgi:ATP-binding cassette subfamily C protein CydC